MHTDSDRRRFAKFIVAHAPLDESCWIWTGACTGGYGSFGVGSRTDGSARTMPAHRFAWEAYRGNINGMWVLHKCDVKLCVRPNHLYLGTHADNTRDAVERGQMARQKGSTNGRSKLNETQAAEIYTRTRNGESPLRLSREFDVARTTVNAIKEGRTWTHCTRPARIAVAKDLGA